MPFPKPHCADHTTIVKGVLFSGIVGVTDDWELSGEDFDTQARQTFANAKEALRKAGLGWDQVAFVRAYLSDIADYKDYSALFTEVFPDNPPARTTVQAGLVGPFRIEIELTVEAGTGEPAH